MARAFHLFTLSFFFLVPRLQWKLNLFCIPIRLLSHGIGAQLQRDTNCKCCSPVSMIFSRIFFRCLFNANGVHSPTALWRKNSSQLREAPSYCLTAYVNDCCKEHCSHLVCLIWFGADLCVCVHLLNLFQKQKKLVSCWKVFDIEFIFFVVVVVVVIFVFVFLHFHRVQGRFNFKCQCLIENIVVVVVFSISICCSSL